MRIHILNEALDLINNESDAEVFDCLDVYINSSHSNLFSGTGKDPNLGVAAFYGGRAAA